MKIRAVLCVLLLCQALALTAQTTGQDDSGGENLTAKDMETLAFGLDSEITSLLSTYITGRNFRYADEVEKTFSAAKSAAVKQKCVEYFTAAEDGRLKDYALEIVSDPYDSNKALVSAVFKYISALKITEAAPAARKIIDDENEDFFDAALDALGNIGSSEDALFLADFLDRPDMPTARRQALMRSLGNLRAVETTDKLISIAEDENENSFVRTYAAEALGQMRQDSSVPVLIGLYDSSDVNLRASAVKALGNYDSNADAGAVVERALRDDHYKVRLESVAAIKSLKLASAADALIYRAKNDPENVVRYSCYDALASLGTSAGNDFLVSILKDNKKGDAAQSKAAASLLEYGNAGIDAVLSLAEETLADDRRKNLRYALGKEFAKYENPAFADICLKYLSSTDISTQGTGLDIYAKNRFPQVTDRVREIAEDEKAGPNRNKAKRILEEG